MAPNELAAIEEVKGKAEDDSAQERHQVVAGAPERGCLGQVDIQRADRADAWAEKGGR